MSRLREFGESAASAVLERVGRGVSRVQESKSLSSDLLESDDAYLVVFDAPGATRSDVQARFVDGAVEVRVDRFRDFHEGYEMRFPGRGVALDGRVALPADAAVDAEGATATLADNGTLRVRVPKAADAEGAADGAVEESERVDVHAGDASDSDAGESDDTPGDGDGDRDRGGDGGGVNGADEDDG